MRWAKDAMGKCAALGVHLIPEPCGKEGHPTEHPVSVEDNAIGDALAYFLGTVFEDDALGGNHSSVQLWERVARSLRFHGLKISDRLHDRVSERDDPRLAAVRELALEMPA